MINKRKQEVIVIVVVLSSNVKCTNSNSYLQICDGAAHEAGAASAIANKA